MATVNIAFLPLYNLGNVSMTANVSSGVESEVITSSATSQVTTIVADEDSRNVCRIVVTGGDVWVKVGPDPEAAAAQDILLLDGTTEYFSVTTGDKVAVIDA